MRPTKRFAPQVEGVESRIVLSGVPGAAALISQHATQLSGRVRGIALFETPHAHGPFSEIPFRGTGFLNPMGRVTMKAFVNNFSMNLDWNGQMALANPFGRVDLQITGSEFSTFNFVVSSATGRFTHLSGTEGVLTLTTGNSGPSNLAPFRMSINPPHLLS